MGASITIACFVTCFVLLMWSWTTIMLQAPARRRRTRLVARRRTAEGVYGLIRRRKSAMRYQRPRISPWQGDVWSNGQDRPLM